MDEPPYTLRRFAFEYLVTLALVFGGFILAGVLTRLLAPDFPDAYAFFLVPSCVPAGLWLRRCGVVQMGWWQFIILFGIGTIWVIVRALTPPGWRYHPLSIVAMFTGYSAFYLLWPRIQRPE